MRKAHHFLPNHRDGEVAYGLLQRLQSHGAEVMEQ